MDKNFCLLFVFVSKVRLVINYKKWTQSSVTERYVCDINQKAILWIIFYSIRQVSFWSKFGAVPQLTLNWTIDFFFLSPTNITFIFAFLAGLGVCQIIVACYVGIYYNVIITYTIFYFFTSIGAIFRGKLPWVGCDNDYNTLNCSSLFNECISRAGIITDNGTCVSLKYLTEDELSEYNVTGNLDDEKWNLTAYSDPFRAARKSPSEEYWKWVQFEENNNNENKINKVQVEFLPMFDKPAKYFVVEKVWNLFLQLKRLSERLLNFVKKRENKFGKDLVGIINHDSPPLVILNRITVPNLILRFPWKQLPSDSWLYGWSPCSQAGLTQIKWHPNYSCLQVYLLRRSAFPSFQSICYFLFLSISLEYVVHFYSNEAVVTVAIFRLATCFYADAFLKWK